MSFELNYNNSILWKCDPRCGLHTYRAIETYGCVKKERVLILKKSEDISYTTFIIMHEIEFIYEHIRLKRAWKCVCMCIGL